MRQLLRYILFGLLLLGTYQFTLGSLKPVRTSAQIGHFILSGRVAPGSDAQFVSDQPDIQQKSNYLAAVGDEREEDEFLRKHLSAKYIAALACSIFLALLSEPRFVACIREIHYPSSRIYILQRVLRL